MKTYELKQSEQLHEHGQRAVLCPVCGFDYTTLDAPHVVLGHDRGSGGWAGRGDLIVIKGSCESGHEFEVCFGFHKGQTFTFCRTSEDT